MTKRAGGLQTLFGWLRSRGGGRKRGARISRLGNEDVTNLCFHTDPGRGFAIGAMASGIDVSMDSHIAGVALRSSLLVTESTVEGELDSSLED